MKVTVNNNYNILRRVYVICTTNFLGKILRFQLWEELYSKTVPCIFLLLRWVVMRVMPCLRKLSETALNLARFRAWDFNLNARYLHLILRLWIPWYSSSAYAILAASNGAEHFSVFTWRAEAHSSETFHVVSTVLKNKLKGFGSSTQRDFRFDG